MSELALKLIAENKKTLATFLDLSHCGLTKIPEEISELVWLEELSLSQYLWNKSFWLRATDNTKTNLNDLTPLSSLNALRILFISNTQVSDLTPLSGLTALQKLNASNTQVSDLTPLSNLSVLQELYISKTQVSDLMPLSGLTALQILDASNTQVSDLTPLSDLSGLGLRKIFVANTQVSDLSPVLALIEQGFKVQWKTSRYLTSFLYGIDVGNCPLINPPEAIVKRGNASILKYFREKQ
ncbi:Internalin H [uncultured bacterium]|nr:Internalin H [uncultured bacterium]